MLKSLPCRLLKMILLFACIACDNRGDNGAVGTSANDYGISIGDYKLIRKGGNSLLHQPGSLHLWYAPKSGKRSLVATYIVEGPEVFPGGVAVFSGGLSDDRRWKIDPALLAYSPGGVPVEITEMVTRKYCLDQKIDYAPLAGAFRYRVEQSSEDSSGQVSDGLVHVRGAKRSDWTESIDVFLSRDEVNQWIQQIENGGMKRSYDGVEYMIPESSKETVK